MSVAIIDYGSGNLHSAAKAFERAACDTGDRIVVTADAEAVATAERIVLPGVGAFADCRRGLDAVPGMVEALNEAVIRRGTPFLGICVGCQLMAERGIRVVLCEANPYLGGKIGAWPVTLNSGEQVIADHGFHAFFRHYYTWRSILRRADPELSFLKPVGSYPVISTTWPAEDLSGLPAAPPLLPAAPPLSPSEPAAPATSSAGEPPTSSRLAA